MNTATFFSMMVSAVLIACHAVPVPPSFTDEKAEKDSLHFNEVGPEENWKLYNQLMKTNSYDPSFSEKDQRLMKEIQEFSRLVNATIANESNSDDATDQPADVIETDSALSEMFPSTWKTLSDSNDGDASNSDMTTFERQDEEGNVEDIIKKISKDLKKLYVKIKQVITVVKNWVNKSKSMTEFDGTYPMSASASDSHGVFVIADPLIGDVDKSNKYTVPIYAD